MPLDNKISNILGTKLPQWLIKQLNTRSVQNSRNSRDNDNIIYLGNKTAWVRLVSSIDISDSDLTYFKTKVGDQTLKDGTDLAKKFILFGGTSIYQDNSYSLRSGLNGSYGMLGKDEVSEYGYRPMPGITNVTIETQGRLGSIRAATINFKVWDKPQLDIIDALYFKLGYTMFLEWGHTFYYSSPQNPNSTTNIDLNKVNKTELLSINPFEQNLTKENILRKISKSSRETEGNYDAMLGMVTNFNFTYNQEGGYDCTLRLMSLGVLGDSIKINNPSILPNLLRDEILKLNQTLIDIAQETPPAEEPQTENKETQLTFDQLVDKYVKDGNGRYTETEKLGWTDSDVTPNERSKADVFFNSPAYGEVLGIRRLKAIVPIREQYWPDIKVVIDLEKFGRIIQYTNYDFTDEKNIEENVPKFKESFKAFLKTVGEATLDPREVPGAIASNKAIAEEQIAQKSTIEYKTISYDKINRGIKNNIEITRGIYAETSKIGAADPFVYISDKEFYDSLTSFLSGNNKVSIKKIEKKLQDSQQNWPGYRKVFFTFEFNLVFDRPVVVEQRTVQNQERVTNETEARANFVLPVTIVTDDTSLIKTIDLSNIDQPKDFVNVEKQKQLEQQNQVEIETQEAQNLAKQELANQVLEALSFQSALEIMLRTIQVKALNNAFYKSSKGKPDLEIGRRVVPFQMSKDFIKQVFSNGIYSDIIETLVYNPEKIPNSSYDSSDEQQFTVNAKYGFATSLLGNKADFTDLANKEVNYKELLKAYVVPYKIDTELIIGIKTNHPVYIPLGLLLMLVNHTCTIYDTKKGVGKSFQKPLVYIDYNPNTNFMLTNPQQLSTNPWVTLIPYEGTFDDYKALFDNDVIPGGNFIVPVSGSTQNTPLFNPQTQDLLSYQLPGIKDGIAYRGKVMNVLLNIDYVSNLVRDNSFKDGSNNVYLKPFLEQILSDINKYLGNFNALRLAYNDNANTFQIVDDQWIPSLSDEEQIPSNPRNDNIENRTEIPLLGLSSIAKSLEIKTEISSKLSNMIAISSNSNPSEQAQLSTNGDSFGFINTNYTDRYIPRKLAASNTGSAVKNGEIIASTQFNQTISDFYSTISPSYTDVSQATSFFIEKMSKEKNNQPASRASMPIPVSVNLTTDGLSGMSMGQAFTVSDQLLPYNYTSNKPGSFFDGYINKVGFAIVGLTHTIEGNSWNTSIKAQMVAVKDKTLFNRAAETRNRNDAQFKEGQSISLSATDKFIDSTAWSAAFISYVMSKATGGRFPVDAGHSEYLNKIKRAGGYGGVFATIGFGLFKPTKTAVQVGDILVYNREGNKNTYETEKYSGPGHGDIVVSIVGNQAVAIGGNVSDTVRQTVYSLNKENKVLNTEYDVFMIVRPKREYVERIVNAANVEYNIWNQGTLNEKNVLAKQYLKAYYASVGLKLP